MITEDQPMSVEQSLHVFWAYEAMEAPEVSAVEHAPAPEAWAVLVAARQNRTHFYASTLPAAIRAFCSPLSADHAWSDEWIQRWAEDDSRERDQERIAAVPAEIAADVRAAIAAWREQNPMLMPEAAAGMEEGFINALVADFAELVFDVASKCRDPRSKLFAFADPSKWAPVLAEARGVGGVASK